MRHIRINNRISVSLTDPKWSAKNLLTIRKVIQACSLKKKGLSLELANDADIKKFNSQWRGIEKPTNVLSFPSSSCKIKCDNSFEYLGDIIISYDTLKKETKLNKIPFRDHFSHILVHGILHLKGYRHDYWIDANIMKKEEIRILEMLRVNTLYLRKNL